MQPISIDRAIFDLPGNPVVGKRKNPFGPLILMLVGGSMIGAAYLLDTVATRTDLASASIFAGFIIAVAGMVLLIVALSGKKPVPYCAATRKRLRRQVMFFDPNLRNDVCAMAAAGAFESLARLPESEHSGLRLIRYATPDGTLSLCQVQEYIPHSYEPVTETFLFRRHE